MTDRGYFFLSYAHSPSLTGDWGADPDRWVQSLFKDLTAAVAELAHHGSEPAPEYGYIDKQTPVGSDLKSELTGALSRCQVFVPLYSPRYFAMSWPGREWACFEDRLKATGLQNPSRRIVPVLWIPLLDQRTMADLPGPIGADPGSPYAENGLRALLRLHPYEREYRAIVRRLATQIVDLAELTPIPPSPARHIDEVPSRFPPEDGTAVFTVTVAAPTLRAVPDGQDGRFYGHESEGWRPFPERQQVSLADYVLNTAERLDFAVEVSDVGKAKNPSSGGPGVVLIDPWITADDNGRAALLGFLRNLPSWVLPVVVRAASANPRGAALADELADILNAPRAERGGVVQRAIEGVDSLETFVALMPVLVAEAEREYLRHGPLRGGTPPAGGRPRLTSTQPAGEEPDAGR